MLLSIPPPISVYDNAVRQCYTHQENKVFATHLLKTKLIGLTHTLCPKAQKCIRHRVVWDHVALCITTPSWEIKKNKFTYREVKK
ncbi:hypothetical protein XELAEV_18042320mg [Xenopus laevis]|uniref:Uncharacterized protein n=1 Tax=Xenopus laevis TaxID=8355 RepID=A0A974C4K6_XENLA|nr:hypothetical protein XELAEV_18042320mg [Xenopus laevis]